jgi:hypothetical protein
MAHDVFVSYSAVDKPIADAMCAILECENIRCWIAPRDVLPDASYGEAIVEAIKLSSVLILVFSANANTSRQVTTEVNLAIGHGIPIIPFRIEDVTLSTTMKFALRSLQWLDAQSEPMDVSLNRLAELTKSTIDRCSTSRQIFHYDELGRLTSATNHDEAQSSTRTSYTYDSMGNQTPLTYDHLDKKSLPEQSVNSTSTNLPLDSELVGKILLDVELVDTPGTVASSSVESPVVPFSDTKDWKHRHIATAGKLSLRESQLRHDAMQRDLTKQIDQCRRETEHLLKSFPSKWIDAIDSELQRNDVSKAKEAIQVMESRLLVRLEDVVRQAAETDSYEIGRKSDLIVANALPSNYRGVAAFGGVAAGAIVGAFLIGGIGGFVGRLVGGWFGTSNAKVMSEQIRSQLEEYADRLSIRVSQLLDEIEQHRLCLTKEQSESGLRCDSPCENAEVSVFSEERLQRASQALVQVFIHAKADRDAAAKESAQRDESSTCRGRHTLAVDVEVGTAITLHLTSSGLEIKQPVQTVTWNGKLESVSYAVRAPNDAPLGKVICTLSVSVRDIPVGYVRFTVTIEEDRGNPKTSFVGDSAHRYERAFISYASKDRSEVLKRIPMLRIHRIEFFQDLLSLEPGDEWEERIYEEIESSDLFLLFWSSAALDSEWVKREWMHALKCRGSGKDGTPDIYPVLIEGPPVPSPPEELKRFHFRDFLAYIAQFEEKSIEGSPNK